MPAPAAERALLWRGPCLAFIQPEFTVCLLCVRHSSRHQEENRDLKNHRAESTAVVIPILGERGEPACLGILGKPCVGGRRHEASSVPALPCLFLHPSSHPKSSLLKLLLPQSPIHGAQEGPPLVAVGGSQRQWGRQRWKGKGQTGGAFSHPLRTPIKYCLLCPPFSLSYLDAVSN